MSPGKVSAMAETFSTFSLANGDPAPDFRLPSPDGSLHALSDVAGAKGLLVIFACNHCPYVVHLASALGELANELAKKEVGVVAISSNDVGKYPQDGPELMSEFAKEQGWDFPYLYDESQEVAKAYGAACTPDFFLFDKDLRLFYAGQFDDTRPRGGNEPDGSDMRAAVSAMLAGESPASDPRPSSGCNIKWIPGNEPAYFG